MKYLQILMASLFLLAACDSSEGASDNFSGVYVRENSVGQSVVYDTMTIKALENSNGTVYNVTNRALTVFTDGRGDKRSSRQRSGRYSKEANTLDVEGSIFSLVGGGDSITNGQVTFIRCQACP